MDYLYIRAWGKMLGSFPSYIEREVEKARKDHAPQTAIYQRQDGSWATFGRQNMRFLKSVVETDKRNKKCGDKADNYPREKK